MADQVKGSRRRRRGSALLIQHCARLDVLVACEGAGGVARLELELGRELATVLLRALTGDHGRRRESLLY
ncbi:MAG: hypothetical protein IT201_02580 [Thermoleophilia bacterium]|nr:hypothetical protein [Thermoleophilia bacterium]